MLILRILIPLVIGRENLCIISYVLMCPGGGIRKDFFIMFFIKKILQGECRCVDQEVTPLPLLLIVFKL